MTGTTTCKDLSLRFEPETYRMAVDYKNREIFASKKAAVLKLNGREAAIAAMRAKGKGLELTLQSEKTQGVWSFIPTENTIESTIHVEEAKPNMAVEISLPFPLTAAVELPVNQKWSARIDASEIQGRPIRVEPGELRSQIAAVEFGGAALAVTVLADYTRHLPGSYGSVLKAGAWRDDDAVWLHLRLLPDCPFAISCHPDLEGLIDGYCASLKERFGILQLHEDESVPAWLQDIKIFAAFEMWRADGEILNTFDHVLSFCRDIDKLGVKSGLVVNLLGFQGPFDSHYPYFDPHPELGGSAGLKSASQAIHATENRLRMHFNVWGLDPYLENFEELEHLAIPYDRVHERIPTGQIGPYDGWPGAYPAAACGYETGKVPLEPLVSDTESVVFETPYLPVPMEGFLTVYDIQAAASGRIRARVGDRQVKAPFGPGRGGNRAAFRFRFRFTEGQNRIRLEFIEGTPDLSSASFSLERTIVPARLWSYPIIRADIHHPEWIQVTRDNLVRVCRDYRVDIPYIDAVSIWRAEDRPIFDAIKEGLPGRVFGCEYPSELTYRMFRLCGTAFKRLPTNEEAGFIVSDFSSRITRRFARMFSAGRFYVSAGRLSPQMGALEAIDDARRAEAEQHMEECRRLGVIPGIRLNYRDHGLDDKAKAVMLEALGL